MEIFHYILLLKNSASNKAVKQYFRMQEHWFEVWICGKERGLDGWMDVGEVFLFLTCFWKVLETYIF